MDRSVLKWAAGTMLLGAALLGGGMVAEPKASMYVRELISEAPVLEQLHDRADDIREQQRPLYSNRKGLARKIEIAEFLEDERLPDLYKQRDDLQARLATLSIEGEAIVDRYNTELATIKAQPDYVWAKRIENWSTNATLFGCILMLSSLGMLYYGLNEGSAPILG